MVEQLALNKEETIIMYSIQRYMLKEDYSREKDVSNKIKKNCWINKWEKIIIEFLKEEIKDKKIKLIYEYEEIINKIYSLNLEEYKKRIILLECALFKGYYTLENNNNNDNNNDNDNKNNNDNKNKNNNNKEIRKIKLDKNIKEQFINEISKDIQLNLDEYKTIKELYMKSKNYYTDKTKKVAITTAIVVGATAAAATGAYLFAPAIAPFFAASGLYGAAAINSGLAVLGGGAIAAGGYGMAGGMIVLVCGGGVLGAGIGAGGSAVAMQLLSTSKEFTLDQLIKLDCAIRYVFLLNSKDTKIVSNIVLDVNNTKKQLDKKLKEKNDYIEELKKQLDKKLKEKNDHIEELKKLNNNYRDTIKKAKSEAKIIERNIDIISKFIERNDKLNLR